MKTTQETKTSPFDNLESTGMQRDRWYNLTHWDAAKWVAETALAGWILLISSAGMKVLMTELIARLGECGAVRVLDGGNRFDAYSIARLVGGYPEVLDRISISRAFTCHQVLSLLESTPADDSPFIVLDMLRTFYDEAVPFQERKQFLRDCIVQLDRIGKLAMGVVSIHPPSDITATILEMRELLRSSATESLLIEPGPITKEPMRLF